MLFYDYLHNNGYKVTLEAIAKPDKVFADHAAPLQAALEHERYVTALINNIYSAAADAKDFRTPSSSTGLSRSRARRRRTQQTSSTRCGCLQRRQGPVYAQQ